MNSQRIKLGIAIALLLAAAGVLAYQFWPDSSAPSTPKVDNPDTVPPTIPSATEPYKGGGSRKAPGVK
jgi:hypothetical protein